MVNIARMDLEQISFEFFEIEIIVFNKLYGTKGFDNYKEWI